ncbi:leukocyte immunoglobulin-like receptor subfamily A member 2 isoform X1 [Macrotis lagotis]|uniref:leukocyte immunoglobulin-like receptor subfamily A member 2 isoform X1 n=1 Tax=Macrotis lagotis TaxID=92651 RepID=UPI003D69BA2D
MTPTLSVLLFLGLCLNQRMKAQAEGLPRPFLWAVNGSLVPEGRSVTLRCRGSEEAEVSQLEKKERTHTVIKEVESNEIEDEFSFQSVTVSNAGSYFCIYMHSTSWSEHSAPLQLVVTGR